MELTPGNAPWAATPRPSRAAPEIGDTSHLRRGGDDGAWWITIPAALPGKDRHRSGNGRHYSTARQARAEALVARCAREQNAGREMLEGPVRIAIVAAVPAPHAGLIGAPTLGLNG